MPTIGHAVGGRFVDADVAILTFFFLGSFLLCVLARPRWQRAVDSLDLDHKPRRALQLTFLCLCALLGLTVLSLMRFWWTTSSLWTSNSPQWMFIALTALVVADMIGFGVVIAPLGLSPLRRPIRLCRATILLQCVLVAPMVALVIWGLIILLNRTAK